MKKRKLCIITGSRAEWGLFYPLANEIKKNGNSFSLQIVATGAHLAPEFGLTYREIEKDGFRIEHKVKMLVGSDSEEAIAKSVSLGINRISSVLRSSRPGLIFLLGDRFEIFSAAIAAFFLKIPIAHIHGGELTEGSLDDSLRHAITKMAYLHFVSTDTYRKRVIQMGEEPGRVFKVGALGVDNIKNAGLLSREELENQLNFKLGKRNIMITFHPSTSGRKEDTEKELKSLLKAANELRDVKIVITKPNPDIYTRTIVRLIDDFVAKNGNRSIAFKSMGRKSYLSALKFMDIVAGNSSSGIIEAPSFGIPTINIGNREKGRIRGDSVIDINGDINSVRSAFRRAFSEGFKQRCKKAKNPYGDGRAAVRIVETIKNADLEFSKKRFHDIIFNHQS